MALARSKLKAPALFVFLLPLKEVEPDPPAITESLLISSCSPEFASRFSPCSCGFCSSQGPAN
ncbi:unnamed protein product [Spirodela intermedia]|uniref:Uncharacterized protein n=1 Tax=Spirodela intermedia TaxID=51605 RepID=A0A7I8KPC3_SPIIN|nr:unnamed protein product [Spirodela intermedia]